MFLYTGVLWEEHTPQIVLKKAEEGRPVFPYDESRQSQMKGVGEVTPQWHLRDKSGILARPGTGSNIVVLCTFILKR